jgi:NAD(P)H-flavin reductase
MIDPMVPRPYHVLGVRPETRDTSTLTLEPVRDASAAFEPGQFNMVYVFGVGEVPISISGDPGHPNPLVHTVRAVGAVTSAVCKAKRGDVLGVRGPFGSHWPVEEAVGKDVVILAGGIGLAPLRPALLAILAHRERYGRVVLLYGARASQELLYARQLNQWRGRFDLDVEVTVDTATRDWRGNVGVVTTLIPRAPFDPEEVVALVCGPEVMMRFTLSGLQDRGVPPESIYISMERNMKCAVGFCGHCQYGPTFICKDGPVFRYDRVASLLKVREV